MATYNVKKVRKEKASDGHQHIVGVVTDSSAFYSNQQVIDSIANGNTWQTDVAGELKAKIKKLDYCPHANCYHKPYLTTAPDHTTKNNLESLPPG